MSQFDDELRDALHAIGDSAHPADLVQRALRTASGVRRQRRIVAATTAVVAVLALSAGGWAINGAVSRPGTTRVVTPPPPAAPSAAPAAPTTLSATPSSAASPSAPTTAITSASSPGVALTSALTSDDAGPAIIATLDVVYCPTTAGDSTTFSRPAGPNTARVTVPADVVADVAQYRDEAHEAVLLAPKGWECAAVYGNDGSGGLVVTPHVSANGVYPANTPMVGFSTSGASAVQTMFDACPIFISAAALETYMGGTLNPGSCARPTGETYTLLQADTASVVDPPVTQGGLTTLSRGIFDATKDQPRLLWISCELPAAMNTVCEAALGQFLGVKSIPPFSS